MLLTEYNEAKQMELVKEEGIQLGEHRGIVRILVQLVKEGLLSKEEGIRRSNLTTSEFEAELAKA